MSAQVCHILLLISECKSIDVLCFLLDICQVYGCLKRSGRDKDVSFFRIPRVISNKGEEVCSLSRRRQGEDFSGYI